MNASVLLLLHLSRHGDLHAAAKNGRPEEPISMLTLLLVGIVDSATALAEIARDADVAASVANGATASLLAEVADGRRGRAVGAPATGVVVVRAAASLSSPLVDFSRRGVGADKSHGEGSSGGELHYGGGIVLETTLAVG